MIEYGTLCLGLSFKTGIKLAQYQKIKRAMYQSTSTTVIEKLYDLELLFKLKADLLRFKKKKIREFKKPNTQRVA